MISAAELKIAQPEKKNLCKAVRCGKYPTMAERTFVISPSYQADWRLSVRFLALLGAVLFVFSLFFLHLGLWVIVPFAGLEFAAVAAALWWTAERANEKNVIKVTDHAVILEKGRRERTSSVSLERIWCEIILEHLPRRWQHTRLFLRCRDVRIEIAEFLDSDEQKQLSKTLKQAIGPVGV